MRAAQRCNSGGELYNQAEPAAPCGRSICGYEAEPRENTERWLSGLKRRPAKPLRWLRCLPGFESRSLRHVVLRLLGRGQRGSQSMGGQILRLKTFSSESLRHIFHSVHLSLPNFLLPSQNPVHLPTVELSSVTVSPDALTSRVPSQQSHVAQFFHTFE